MKDWRKIYRMEIWVTIICFVLLALTGGMISSFYVVAKDALFFDKTTGYAAKAHLAGFPVHYFWLIVFSWLGATVIGIVWAMYMDKMERDIEGKRHFIQKEG